MHGWRGCPGWWRRPPSRCRGNCSARPMPPATLARHGFRFPLLVRTPGFHTGRHFRARGKRRSAGRRGGGAAGKGIDRHRVSGCARRRWQGAQVPRDDDRRTACIRCTWRFRATGRSTTSPPKWPTGRTIAPRMPNSWTNMPGVLGPRAMEALAQIQATLGLDYAGIDFGLSEVGRTSAV